MHSFDHFHIIRQGLLLSIDTFGVSHILPILSLPFIAVVWYNSTSKDSRLKDVILNNITQVLYMGTLTIKANMCMFWKRFDVKIQQMNRYIIHFVNVHIDAKFKLLDN
jgi:phosphatidylinositol glycan class O